ncbi:acyl carrier protein [Candidatus Magnetobacterium bavaricum]|uniref:Acyl carrier protein n=1 Tax=Candidatus Magnetobacterium bavaricum TaxID=29290 RepID=A0A0F3GX96_9BACT|nr:acyl carrier protein [Candidatus Magnetobacterium bavaricum]
MSNRERLEKVFRDVFDDEEIVIFDKMTAADIEKWDSLTHVQLIVAVEREFAVRLKTAEIIGFKNVGDLLHILEEKVVN